jgi:dinuclear metal center YbgI/SA1388 family protein
MPNIREIAKALEAWSPKPSAQSYDNVGLQVGRFEAEVQRCIIALDLTPQVIQEAIEAEAQLIITHHPNIFRPIKNVTNAGYVNEMALRLAENRVAHYAIHTNLDAALGGVSFALAQQLGLKNIQFLEAFSDSLLKLVVFVPKSHAEAVRLAIGEAGAGCIGAYDFCAFETEGHGYFRPNASANPYIGKEEQLETVGEVRLEAEVQKWDLGRVVAAMKKAHPYEEVAYDVYALHQPSTQVGMGAIGELSESMPVDAFLDHICAQLDTPAVRVAADASKSIRKVAVCGGSGSSLIGLAQSKGADAFVTADVTYHFFFNTHQEEGKPQMAIVDVGHYESEAITEQLLCDWLSARFSEVEWRKTAHKTNPTQMWIKRGMV